MKKVILFLIISICFSFSAFGQNEATPKFTYCELLGTQKLLSQKVTITVDFGQEMSLWKDNRLKDEISGKVQVFNSMVDALNYMGGDGWEFVQAYVVTIGQQNVYHWLLKKRVE